MCPSLFLSVTETMRGEVRFPPWRRNGCWLMRRAVTHGKVTPAVRKILQSQKTFANHLDDFEALQSAEKLPNAIRSASGTSTPNSTKRSHKKKDPNAPAPTPLRKVSSVSQIKSEDEPMLDAPMLSLNNVSDPPPHPKDNDPLLVSRIPIMPTQAEIDKLLAAPPLSYNEARGTLTYEDRRKPVRTFCEVCGYWARVKCARCGGRVCALECLNVHQEECFTRYGA
jgi:zinc finger HIT domain-containing protein 1